jgi:hypothetical protein
MDIPPSPDLQSFLALAEAAIHHASGTDEPVRVAAEAVLKMPPGEVGEAGAARLPVRLALDNALLGKVPLAPWLTPLPSSTRNSTGHASATTVGAEGLEIRRGVSLMTPHRQGQ